MAPALLAALLGLAACPAAAQALADRFDDPWLQVTDAIRTCPPQHPARLSPDAMRAEAHARIERGTSCYQAGRCRLPNAYLYDREIVPRVEKAIRADRRFDDSSIFIEGQRRWVWLRGCVRSREASVAVETLVRDIDDVEAVINLLEVRPP